MKLGVAIAVLLLAAGISRADEPLSFKGFELGAPQDTFLSAFPRPNNCKGAAPSSQLCVWLPASDCRDERSQCFQQINYGGVVPNGLLVDFVEGRLASVRLYFRSSEFRKLKDALVLRFGAPADSKTEVVQNRMGATFNNDRLLWLRQETLLSIRERAGKVDEGVVMLTSKSFMERRKEQDSGDLKARAKNL